ncbi:MULTISPECIES: nucleoside permease [unclassified Gilliamella]|uniref:nucleoside permease n=1 Tax=unclassified Gilliamella TaxID=2685620 RepID=UPI0022699503|nr:MULTISPECIES: nucleoside permease [unclassified Gilliamella]MCX8641150.1 MFS transporter [Gilliamella sp. B3835]MCX8707091.1 MFS transporter [Gilliamella sp. B3783]MCX8710412.1 MFS transporter [Gilliamella sp. B3780]MCX8715094.1 MFS transporter [Gilliamella sp. B3781]MCX8716074.1 MFS transporter [Gilliamella sp. B3784]
MNIKNRLKIMMFFQYFIWGSWLTTLGIYLFNTLKFSGAEIGMIFSTKGLAALIMPCIIGIIADKFIQAKYLYMLCHSICAVALFYAASVTTSSLLFWLMFANAMAFMPTIALSNSISYACLDKNNLNTVEVFPKIRVFGTVGFIIAMWMISLLKLDSSNGQLYVACVASVVLVIYSATLPNIEIKQNQQQSWASRLGLDAFVLFKKPVMAVFFLFAMLLGAILQITNTFGGAFLKDFGKIPEFSDSLIVQHPAILLSVSQMAEVAFILTIPFFLKKFGIKKVIMISLIAWTLRFGLFAFGDPTPFGFVLLLLSMIVYGCAFDFFNISGSIFIEKEVNANIRASAQGLFMTMVNGIGAYLGSILSGMVVDEFTYTSGRDWQTIWLIFASYALVLGIIFYFTFNYDHNRSETVKQ